MTSTLTPPESEERQATPSSEFILKRILRNDAKSRPEWGLNPEMRGEFSRMLAE